MQEVRARLPNGDRHPGLAAANRVRALRRVHRFLRNHSGAAEEARTHPLRLGCGRAVSPAGCQADHSGGGTGVLCQRGCLRRSPCGIRCWCGCRRIGRSSIGRAPTDGSTTSSDTRSPTRSHGAALVVFSLENLPGATMTLSSNPAAGSGRSLSVGPVRDLRSCRAAGGVRDPFHACARISIPERVRRYVSDDIHCSYGGSVKTTTGFDSVSRLWFRRFSSAF